MTQNDFRTHEKLIGAVVALAVLLIIKIADDDVQEHLQDNAD